MSYVAERDLRKLMKDSEDLIEARAEIERFNRDLDNFKEHWRQCNEHNLKKENEHLRAALELVRSQMCWEADRDRLTMGMKELHPMVTQALAAKAKDEKTWKPITDTALYDPELKNKYVCGHCGQPISPDKFCAHSGVKLDPPTKEFISKQGPNK